VWGIQTPAFNHNEGFVSKYQPSHGYVERTLASNSSPLTWCQSVNESISALGGRVLGECKSPTGKPPVRIGEFCKGINDGELYFVGGSAPDFLYSIQLGWGAPNQQRCGSSSGTP
jgi:hypothetical protein